jgi:D-glycero-D-manno-heptose 1,7-bisphosphate phosphatase
MIHKAVFLDRDGTITEDTGYTFRLEDLLLIPNAGKGLQKIAKLGYRLVVVSKQGGIALGKFTEADVHLYHNKLNNELLAFDVKIEAFYFSPYHTKAVGSPLGRDSECRKPNPGMLLKASQDLQIDLKQSIMIGDRWSDILAGQRAGCKTILLKTGVAGGDPEPLALAPDFWANDLDHAAEYLGQA